MGDGFYTRLAESLKEQLITQDHPDDEYSFIYSAIKIDNHLRECDKEMVWPFFSPTFLRDPPRAMQLFPWRSPLPETTAPLAGRKEPTQLVCAKLIPQKQRQRLQEGRCIFYGQSGHYLSSCQIKVQAHWSKGEHWWAKYNLLSSECELLQTLNNVHPMSLWKDKRANRLWGWWKLCGL